ncbi:putative iron-sulfur cluster binding protein [Hyphomonas neptunium ATCC 15444]|uniref:Epoxyqueuosine reductase n=2 Tax=Hyphomonas TaxID=85 RepID=Q0BXL4_HYPNA|nr:MULTISPECIES: tRNA epoxyqueuosine(34) reductase QueG [Hyphomonas]ABI78048.1 putative iron-sulfur cluster binding protein [Hyphomonas neptunium ATCC 15444]KCZ89889.1 putative iron-sulfur cluster binding protein [Hyphomonas hirschiana VP5]
MQSSISDPAARLKERALALGFDAAGIARADEAWPAAERLKAFVELGRHGDMAWMETTLARRAAPTAMWPEARSALVVAMNYGPDHNPLDTLAQRQTGNISVYARGRDYHDLIKSRLKQLAGEVAQITGADVKVFVDTAPLMEKPLAQKAGLGWQGRHTNLVSRDLGSWFFLGTVLTSAALTPDAPEPDHCGSCRACLDICPTNAFPAPYQLDARRCISYLTIESAGPIPAEFRPAMGNRIYGCDDCLAACPWNKFASSASEAALFARAELKGPGLDELAALDDAAFRDVFSGSPVKRSGRDRFVRNVAIAIGNSGEPRLAASLLPLLQDPAPIVRGAAIWALARLDPARFAEEKARLRPSEHDMSVQAEWDERPA